MAPTAPPFFRMAPTAPPFFSVSARFRKTRRYTNVVCCEVLSARIGKTGRYTNGLLPPEDRAFGANPRPECSANFFLGRTHSFNLSFSFPRFVAWPLELGLGTHNPRFGVAPRVGVRDSQSTLFCVAPRVGVRDSQSTLCCVAPRVGVRDSQSMRRFSAFFLGKCSMGRFPLQNLSKASMVPKPKPVCAET